MLDTHTHKLIFRIDNGCPEDYFERWKKIKSDCEEYDNKYIIDKMKTYCKLEQNKNIPYLQREEGGIGGNNNNQINKQMRFFRTLDPHMCLYYNDKVIILDQITNTDAEKWSYDELDDLIRAFTKTFNYFVESECVNGSIEMSNKKSLYNNYLDSDDE
jgi:hypothetical protein